MNDAEIALKIAEEATGEFALEAAGVALHLSPGETGSASVLLKSTKPELMQHAMISVLDVDVKKVWPFIKDRLYDANEEIRNLTCAYAIKKMPPPQLRMLLDQYIDRDRYYYNVVFFLDRAIYAKLPLRRIFIEQIEAVLR